MPSTAPLGVLIPEFGDEILQLFRDFRGHILRYVSRIQSGTYRHVMYGCISLKLSGTFECILNLPATFGKIYISYRKNPIILVEVY
jgi:hypothetical protein